jgi:hypothetical protein
LLALCTFARGELQLRAVYFLSVPKMLGRALYNFATYEWMVAWTLEKLDPGVLSKCTRLPAGKIAKRFDIILRDMANVLPLAQRQALQQAHLEFSRSVERRDQLVHAHPGTAPSDVQQLFYSAGWHAEMQWSLQQVEQAAIDFENAFISLNAIFYEFQPCT